MYVHIFISFSRFLFIGWKIRQKIYALYICSHFPSTKFHTTTAFINLFSPSIHFHQTSFLSFFSLVVLSLTSDFMKPPSDLEIRNFIESLTHVKVKNRIDVRYIESTTPFATTPLFHRLFRGSAFLNRYTGSIIDSYPPISYICK